MELSIQTLNCTRKLRRSRTYRNISKSSRTNPKIPCSSLNIFVLDVTMFAFASDCLRAIAT